MAYDNHANLAYGTVLTAPSPATTGASLVLNSGQGATFPAAPFNVLIWPSGVQPTTANAEFARCTAISGDTLTLTRHTEGSSARTVVVGDQVGIPVSSKVLTDIEAQTVLNAKTGFALGKAGAIGATETDNSDVFYIVPWDGTLAKMKVVCKTAPSGAMVVQLRTAAAPITNTISWSNVTGFSVTFSSGNFVATADPADVNVSEGDLLGFSVSTGSGRDMMVVVTAVAR